MAIRVSGSPHLAAPLILSFRAESCSRRAAPVPDDKPSVKVGFKPGSTIPQLSFGLGPGVEVTFDTPNAVSILEAHLKFEKIAHVQLVEDVIDRAKSKGLTKQQEKVLRAMAEHYYMLGEPCTVADLARSLRKSRTTIRQHIDALKKKGFNGKMPGFGNM